ncbi:unnamed protein product, partial [Rotaria sordida]
EEWLLKHQEIIPQISAVIYRKGRKHGDADAMSRPDIDDKQKFLNVITRSMMKSKQYSLPNNNFFESKSTDNDNQSTSSPMTFDFSLERISEEQKQDPQLLHIKQQILKENVNNLNYVIENDVLYKIIQLPHAYTKSC